MHARCLVECLCVTKCTCCHRRHLLRPVSAIGYLPVHPPCRGSPGARASRLRRCSRWPRLQPQGQRAGRMAWARTLWRKEGPGVRAKAEGLRSGGLSFVSAVAPLGLGLLIYKMGWWRKMVLITFKPAYVPSPPCPVPVADIVFNHEALSCGSVTPLGCPHAPPGSASPAGIPS